MRVVEAIRHENFDANFDPSLRYHISPDSENAFCKALLHYTIGMN